jgi:hypothetical protein
MTPLVGVDNSMNASSLSALKHFDQEFALKAIIISSPLYWHFILSVPSDKIILRGKRARFRADVGATWFVLLLLKTLTRRRAF